MDQRDAAEVGGGGEARHVADHAAPEGDERRGTVGVRTDERVVDACDRREPFVALAVRHQNRLLDAGRARKPLAVQPPDEWTRDHEAPFGRPDVVEQARNPIDGAVGQGHDIGAGRSGDVDTSRIHHECAEGERAEREW